MKLLSLKLINFGRFHNFELLFKDGFNLIYGENEAGKSTILKFIKGMLYGFKVYGYKRSVKDEDFNRFYPWDSEAYRGVMRYTVNERSYRVERDFAGDWVKVYDDVTGKEITGDYPQDRRREVLFAEHQFGLNERVFINTVCVPQMSCKSDDSLAAEVRDRLAALSSAGPDLTATKAVDMLTAAANELGTDKPSGKPIGRELVAKAELAAEKQRVEQTLDLLRQNRLLLTSKEREKAETLREIKRLKEMLAKGRASMLKKRMDEVQGVIDERAQVRMRLKDLVSYRDFPADGAETVRHLKLKLDYRKDNLKKLKAEELDKQKTVEEETRAISAGFPEFESCDFIEAELEDKNAELGKINTEALYSKAESLKEKLQGIMSTVKLNAYAAIISGVAGLMALFFGMDRKPLLGLGAALAVVMFGLLMLRSKNSRKFQEIQQELNGVTVEIQETLALRDEIEASINNLLISVNCSSLKEFKSKAAAYRQRHGKMMVVSSELDRLSKTIGELKEEIEALESKLGELLKMAGCTDVNEYFEGCKKHAELASLCRTSEELEKRLSALLSGTTLEDLKKELEECPVFENETVKPLTPSQADELENKIRALDRALDDINQALTAARTVEQEKLSGLRDLAEIEEDLAQADIRYRRLKMKREAFLLAAGTIKALSEELHREFAPALNKNIGRIVSLLTDNRYSEVKVDETLKISTNVSDSDSIKPVDALSCGTVDQFYFALRAALADVVCVQGVKLPLIIDDAFVNYDDVRFTNAIEFLTRLAQERQVILFTCHRRGMEILTNRKSKMNIYQLGGIE
jgi:DNA repair exonuclease SbcCD ATPase subunit